jgi:hypothetical protein
VGRMRIVVSRKLGNVLSEQECCFAVINKMTSVAECDVEMGVSPLFFVQSR